MKKTYESMKDGQATIENKIKEIMELGKVAKADFRIFTDFTMFGGGHYAIHIRFLRKQIPTDVIFNVIAFVVSIGGELFLEFDFSQNAHLNPPESC